MASVSVAQPTPVMPRPSTQAQVNTGTDNTTFVTPLTLTGWIGGGGGGGSGTVTSVSVTTANGVSGTVATATTTPAITLQVAENVLSINQTAHGFTVNQCVYYTGSAWALSKANAASTAFVQGVVTTVTDANNFIITTGGTATISALTAGKAYYLSDATAGLLTSTAPTSTSSFVVPVLITTSTTQGVLEIGAPASLALIPNASLANSSVTIGSTNVALGATVGTFAGVTLTTPVIASGLTASGSGANDFSGSTGTFKTSTGANTLNGTTVVSGSSFGLSGNISAPAWTTAGIRYKNVAATLTDTTSSGAVAAAYTDVWGGNTIAASSSTTFTNYYAAYFKAASAGTNVTLTNTWALGADSASFGSSTPTTISSSGVITTTGSVLGTPASVTLTNGSGLPIAGTTGWGTGVATAAGNAINGAGGFDTTDGTATLTNKTFNTTGTGNSFAYGGSTLTGGSASVGTYGSIIPFYVYTKSVTVLTSGAPADLGFITLPASFTRYRVANGTGGAVFSGVIAETASGTLAAGTFQLWDDAGGTGSQLSASFSGPTAAGVYVAVIANSSTVVSTTGKIYLRQTVASANAGTVSFYLCIYPMP